MSGIPKKYIKYIKSRLSRGFSLVSLGPNEARLFYDFLAGYTAVFLVMTFNIRLYSCFITAFKTTISIRFNQAGTKHVLFRWRKNE